MMQVPERRPRVLPVDAYPAAASLPQPAQPPGDAPYLPVHPAHRAGQSTSAAPSPSGAALRQVPPSRPDTLLALADGSLWFGWNAERAKAVAGPVRLDGRDVIIGDRVAMTLQGHDVTSLGHRLEQARSAGRSIRGCVTAAGATLPIHEAVARAIAAGQIGSP